MAEKLCFDEEEHNISIGKSFEKHPENTFNSIRYDFKPASVDTKTDSTIDIASNTSVTVTVPHIEGSGTTHTVYKGNKRGLQKECILLIDQVSGNFTLEKLTDSIQLKKTRIDGSSKAQQLGRPITPVDGFKQHKDQKASSASKNKNSRSKAAGSSRSSSKSQPAPAAAAHTAVPAHVQQETRPRQQASEPGKTELMSDSSSSDSSSSDSSDAESHPSARAPPTSVSSSYSKHQSIPNRVSQDLQLSESGSDSD